MLTIDVINAFNTVPWDAILSATSRRLFQDYLVDLFGSYLHNREIKYNTKCVKQTIRINCGVP